MLDLLLMYYTSSTPADVPGSVVTEDFPVGGVAVEDFASGDVSVSTSAVVVNTGSVTVTDV